MAGKVNLDIQTILDKEFNIDFKGYNASEVDAFLDLVIQDYETYQSITSDLNEKIAELEEAPLPKGANYFFFSSVTSAGAAFH